MTIAALIRLREKQHELVQGVRQARFLQKQNHKTIAECERENAELEALIQANKAAAKMLGGYIRRARQQLPSGQAAE